MKGLKLYHVIGLALFGVSQATLWPKPQTFTNGSTSAYVVPNPGSFFVMKNTQESDTLTQAFDRYDQLTFPHPATDTDDSSPITSLIVSVDDIDEVTYPQLDTDESYTLNIPAEGGDATLEAATIYGALRGLETFSQLVLFDFDARLYSIDHLPWSIDDAPRFPHRGLMIDTARHFQPLSSIRSIIDSLTFAKLNVLHWHMVDTQSFPFESISRPLLWTGSYSKRERYLQSEVANIVEYARLRGVKVMVEFDVPGHAASWCTGYPDICPSPDCQQPLDVSNEETFSVITDLLNDCTGGVQSSTGSPSGLFPNDFIHLGGDEVDTTCWEEDADISAWLSANNMTADDGYAYFVQRVGNIAISQGRRPVQWSEVYDHFKTDLDPATIVHVWKEDTNVTEVVENGYATIVNVGYDDQSWYLDNLDVAWDAMYSKDPCSGWFGDVPDDLCESLVLGGHGEMWGETVDASDLAQTVWPRMAAIAERLWSPAATTGSDTDPQQRLMNFRCLLNERGVASAPVLNKRARQPPPEPDSCYNQRRRLLEEN
jgi:hexosaminidase